MKKIPQRLIELSLSGQRTQEGLSLILKNILLSIGVDVRNIVEYAHDSTAGVAVFLKTMSEARALQKKIEAFQLKSVTLRLTQLKKPDWQEKWKKDFNPFPLTGRLDVVPVWRRKDYQPKKNREPIYIDTVSAFGTGLHDTTRFMSILIEQCQGRFKSFLDVGTGTGLLAIVALKSGAGTVDGIDSDPECLPVARSNMKRNHYTFNDLQIRDLAEMVPQRPYDFVAANLISADLCKMKRNLLKLVSPGKFLAVSGISVENFPTLKKEFSLLPLRCLKILKSQNWVAVLYQKKK